MAKNPLTLVSDRRVPADQLVKEAIGSVRANQMIHRVERMYPRIRAPLEGVADALMDACEVDEARTMLAQGIAAMAEHWDADMESWRQNELDAMGLLRQVLTRLFQPAMERLGKEAPEALRFQAAPSGERLEGNRVWAQLRLQQFDASDLDAEDECCPED